MKCNDRADFQKCLTVQEVKIHGVKQMHFLCSSLQLVSVSLYDHQPEVLFSLRMIPWCHEYETYSYNSLQRTIRTYTQSTVYSDKWKTAYDSRLSDYGLGIE